MKFDELLNVLQGEPEILALSDKPYLPNVLVRITPITGRRPGRHTQKPFSLIEPDRLNIHARPLCEFAGSHHLIF